MIPMTTNKCMMCGTASVVDVTQVEYDNLVNTNMTIQDALPDRDLDFRELILTGLHSQCFDLATSVE